MSFAIPLSTLQTLCTFAMNATTDPLKDDVSFVGIQVSAMHTIAANVCNKKRTEMDVRRSLTLGRPRRTYSTRERNMDSNQDRIPGGSVALYTACMIYAVRLLGLIRRFDSHSHS